MSIPLQQIVGGKYEIVHKIKEGGVGVIYKVRHRLLDEDMVIKVLRQQLAFDDEMVQRFQNEAKSAIRLHHPNIARIHDFSADPKEGIAFIVMEFIEGVSLEDMLRTHGPASLELTIEISRQFLNALGFLHDHGIVHRDVAADNIMLSRADHGEPLVKLIDLGIAKSETTAIGLTSTGVYLGKFHYSSPEHFATGSKDPKVERRSDLYSFGVLLYRLLTGEYPIRGDDFRSLAAGHLFRDPVPFSETDPDGQVPPGLASVVLRALAKNLEDRIGSAEQFSLDLAEFAGSGPYRSELDTIFAAVEDSGKPAPSERPGSTQERIDNHFKATDETAEGLISEERDLEPSRSGTTTRKVSPSERTDEALETGRAAWQIDRAIQEGRLDDAEEALGEALESYGEIDVLVGLRERLVSRREAEPIAPEPVPDEPKPPPAKTQLLSMPEIGPPPTQLLSPEELPQAEAVRRETDRRHVRPSPWTRARTAAAGVPARAWAGLSIALVLVAALGVWLSRPAPPTGVDPEGTLVLNALPWAQITAIADADGPRELPERPFTPLAISLPPGTYTVTLTHPSVDEPREIEVQIGTGVTTSEQIDFARLDAEGYFRRIGW